jgi:hypothetical protein
VVVPRPAPVTVAEAVATAPAVPAVAVVVTVRRHPTVVAGLRRAREVVMRAPRTVTTRSSRRCRHRTTATADHRHPRRSPVSRPETVPRPPLPVAVMLRRVRRRRDRICGIGSARVVLRRRTRLRCGS